MEQGIQSTEIGKYPEACLSLCRVRLAYESPRPSRARGGDHHGPVRADERTVSSGGGRRRAPAGHRVEDLRVTPVAADEAILTLPESPLLDVPPLRAIVPLTPAVPPLAVATSNEPLDVAVPLPVAI